jgi:hypothetical protein
MQEQKPPVRRLTWIDGCLIAATLAVASVGVHLVTQSPNLLRQCLRILDVRNWTYWTWVGIAGALLGVLLAIRIRPDWTSGHSNARKEESNQ